MAPFSEHDLDILTLTTDIAIHFLFPDGDGTHMGVSCSPLVAESEPHF